jgi:5-methylcytosine-specific restriction endonuclease McrA
VTDLQGADMNQYKTCSKCRQTKPFDAFHKDKYKSSGLTASCGECRNSYKKQRLENPDVRALANQKSKEYYWNNKELMSKNYKLWVQANKSKRQEIDKRARLKNREKLAANMKVYRQKNPHVRSEWARSNPDKQRAIYANRRARKKGLTVFRVTHSEMNKLYSTPCIYCGSKIDIQIDHVIPLAKGGAHSIGNLAPACKPCNMSKKDLFLTEWKYGKRINKKINRAQR